MADVDEDVIPRNVPDAGETDLSDETQDFRFLASISREDAKIPKRGEKDFEPHATALQSNTLAASRAAMHDALSFQRVHLPKKHNLAVYHPDTNMAYLDAPHSTLFKSIGKVFSPKQDPLHDMAPNSNRLWLLPEEIVYLVERGTVDCRWPAETDKPDDSGLPMSLQGAHSAFIGLSEEHQGGLTFERYSVYSALKRTGYAVHRAASWTSPSGPPGHECFPPMPGTWQNLGLAADQWWRSVFGGSKISAKMQSTGPLTTSGLYRDYSSIYQSLALIPFYDPAAQSKQLPTDPDAGIRLTYNVWKPSNSSYKKSDPGEPDFRIAVLDARQTSIPSLAELSGLFATVPYQAPAANAQLYAKLKNGHKNVILAVVDEGITSYLRLTDAAFGREKLYERKPGPKGKGRGGKGGGRGRGR